MVICIQSGVANFEYVLSNMSFIFLIIVPILTMRVIAEERRQKTDQLLYSLPLGMTRVVLGKYLAMLVVFAIPTAVIGLYPLILSLYGSVYLPAALGTLVGFFFLGAALLSIGMFLSSLTESQAVAAGLCFVVMLLNYFVSSLAGYVSSSAFGSFAAFTVLVVLLALVIGRMTKNSFAAWLALVLLQSGLTGAYLLSEERFEGAFPAVMEQLSPFDRFYQFVDGVFDVTALVYFLTVIGLFLFLTVQSMEKRRWSE